MDRYDFYQMLEETPKKGKVMWADHITSLWAYLVLWKFSYKESDTFQSTLNEIDERRLKEKDIDRESSRKYRDEERLIKILYNEEN